MDAFLVMLKGAGPAAIGWALVAAYTVAVLRGHLVPGATVAAMRADADKRVEQVQTELTHRHAGYLDLAAANRELIHQNGELLEVARTARAVMTSLPTAGEVGL